MKPTIYELITNQIIAAIDEGAATHRMPWHRSRFDIASPSNAATDRHYRGVNILTLWMVAEAKGYGSGQWATYRQWQERGAQVRKGEKSTTAIFWKQLGGSDSSAEGAQPVADSEDGQRQHFVARAYSLFNADQVDGYTAPEQPALSDDERIAAAEAFFARIPATIAHGGNSACYIPADDRVQMPPFDQFTNAARYYSVLAHELTHWSGAKARLDRDLSGRFGSESYAMEELVAELGAAFVTGQLGLPGDPRTDHASYIASWLKVLKGDPRAIFTAASKAQAAADYLMGFQPVDI